MPQRPWIDWVRWFAPFVESIDVEERGGFLTDPQSEYGRFFTQSVFEVKDLLDRHCLILCGEPGMGKTTELDEVVRLLKGKQENVIRVNFRSCLDAADFARKTFRSKRWKTWLLSQSRLCLVIDGVDEGLWIAPNFLEWFIDELRGEVPLERLCVVLACRTLEWPQDLGQELAGLWSEPTEDRKGPTGAAFKLCPLTRAAAASAAEAHGVSGNEFLGAVHEKQVQELAAVPLTLFMLLDEFRDKGREFGRTRSELYLEFCSRLCRDHDVQRANRLRRRKVRWLDYGPTQLQTVAGRIGAMMLIGAKNSVLLPEGGTPTSTDLLIREVEVGVESDSTGDFPVTEDLIRATLGATGLFNSKGSSRFGFEHQTFAECLAAEYLASIQFGPLRTILFRRDGSSEYVVPQLAELAAWIAAERDDVFDFLLNRQPEILLRSDLAHLSADRKRAVIDALLDKAAKAEYFERVERRPFYAALTHPALAEQLRRPLLDRKLNDSVRWLALDIATACKCSELFPSLLTILKRGDDPISIQVGYALDDLVDQQTAPQLIPIVEDTFAPTQPRAVRLSALRGLIATVWSVTQAVPWAKQLGKSADFLDWYLADRMTAADVLGVMRTLSDCKGIFDPLFRLRKVVMRALIFALDQLDNDETKGLVAGMLFREIVEYRLQRWDDAGEFGKRVETNATVRRGLLLEIHRLACAAKSEHRWQIAQLFAPEDLLWLMDRASSSTSAERDKFLEMVTWLMRPEVVAPQWDEVVLRIERSSALRSLKAWFAPWNLRSRKALKARADWKKWMTRRERHEQALARNKLPAREPLIDKALAIGREGKPEAWVNLSEWVFITDSRDWSGGLPYFDIISSPGWQCADEPRRTEMRDLAHQFLLSLTTELRSQPNQSTNFSDAAFAASWLLRAELARPGPLRDAFAKHCVPTVIWGFCSDDEVVSELTKLIYFLNPERCREKFLEHLEFDGARDEGITLAARPFLGCWDAELSKIAERFLLMGPRRAETIRSLFAEIARVDPVTVQKIWRSLAERYAISIQRDPVPMAAATELIIELFAESLWDELFPFLVSHPDVARISVLRSAHYGHGFGLKPPLPLTEVHLGKLYLLLYKIFPPSDPEERWPDDGEPHRVGARHAAGRFRDSLRDQLVARGTRCACDELKRICSKVVKDDRLWTKKRWLDCIEITRQKEWKPVEISAISEVVRRRNAYWVQTEDDLLIVVNESLDELQRSLKSPAGDVIDFWNFERTGGRTNKHKPKPELDVARIIYARLRAKLAGTHGAIVHREVAVQWDQRRTDIEVIVLNEKRRAWRELAIVIEVKLAWNARVQLDARDQLRDHYLHPTARTHGVYLVAWFECSLWKPMRRKLKSRTVEGARKEVASICRKASTPGYTIAPFVLECGLPD
jgi:hypothetical protein